MKKFISIFAIAVVAAFVFVSCSKDDDKDDNAKETTPAPASVEMEFRFVTGGLLYVGTHFEINYEVGNNKGTVTEAEAASEWLYLSTVKLPCTFKFSRTYNVNQEYPGLFVADHSFDYQTGYKLTYRFLDADGKPIEGSEVSINEVTSATVNGDKMAEKINNGQLNSEHIFIFDKDGNLTRN